MPDPDPLDSRTKCLVADLEHFAESLWRNEEIGEKRFNFFLAFVTAVIAGLVALHTGKQQNPFIDGPSLRRITNAGCFGLLVLGFLTYLRMLHRNRVTDQYKRTLRHIREKLLNGSIPGYVVPQPLDANQWKWFKGGLAEMVGTINALLLGALLILNSVSMIWAGLASLLLLAILWWRAALRRDVT